MSRCAAAVTRLRCSATRVTRSLTQGSTMNSPGWRSSELSTVFTDTLIPGTTASACALTSWVSWWRSARRNGRTRTSDITGLLAWCTRDDGGRYPCGTSRMLPTMTLEILQVPGCPGADLLAARLDGLLAGRFPVTRRVVSTQADAERLGMAGSPTLLADGADPFARPDQLPSVSCRLYRDERGRQVPAPSAEQLRAILGP